MIIVDFIVYALFVAFVAGLCGLSRSRGRITGGHRSLVGGR